MTALRELTVNCIFVTVRDGEMQSAEHVRTRDVVKALEPLATIRRSRVFKVTFSCEVDLAEIERHFDGVPFRMSVTEQIVEAGALESDRKALKRFDPRGRKPGL